MTKLFFLLLAVFIVLVTAKNLDVKEVVENLMVPENECISRGEKVSKFSFTNRS